MAEFSAFSLQPFSCLAQMQENGDSERNLMYNSANLNVDHVK
jgi:hypothetical protein